MEPLYIKQYDYLVFIGRFNPLHDGHIEVITKALKMAEHVIVLVGSANQPSTIKNPFSFDERKKMLLGSVESDALSVLPLRDFKYDNNVWAANVQRVVAGEVTRLYGWTDKPLRGGIIGHEKDASSFYLKLFPQWDLIDHPLNEDVSATDIRKLYFEKNIKFIQQVVPQYVYGFLESYKTTQAYKTLVQEYEYIEKYKQSWAVAPYAPTFLTADALVVQSGHVLLVKRRAYPGKGLWALPGGFVNQSERIEDAMLRELKEETNIKLPVPVLRGSIKESKIFDAPDRSLRGRTVTQTFLIELPAGDLISVRGGDDAVNAKWVPISFIREEELFEDHYGMITYFLGQLVQ